MIDLLERVKYFFRFIRNFNREKYYYCPDCNLSDKEEILTKYNMIIYGKGGLLFTCKNKHSYMLDISINKLLKMNEEEIEFIEIVTDKNNNIKNIEDLFGDGF